MINYFSSNFKLGILGGGQLGRMLLAETQKFDIYTCVMDAAKNAPCVAYCNEFYQGSLLDYDTVYNFGKKVDILTVEIENINVDALEQLEKDGIIVYPSSTTLRTVQNKISQKLFYVDHKIPSAHFSRYAYSDEILTAVKHETQAMPFVWKSAKFGYDGTGVKIVKSNADLKALPNVACIVEELIPFKKELAVIVARNSWGDIQTYPVVEMEFHNEANQVEYVICPARISDQIRKKAEKIALKVSEAFEHVGLLAVELFLTNDNEVLVNEVAPRPHNSGHYSIEASYTNQFEQHLRAILNLPLGNPSNKISGVMVNLVGEEGYTGDVIYKNMDTILDMKGVTPHIYGKKITKPFRKMGHVTIVNKTLNTAIEIAEKVKKTIRVISSEK